MKKCRIRNTMPLKSLIHALVAAALMLSQLAVADYAWAEISSGQLAQGANNQPSGFTPQQTEDRAAAAGAQVDYKNESEKPQPASDGPKNLTPGTKITLADHSIFEVISDSEWRITSADGSYWKISMNGTVYTIYAAQTEAWKYSTYDSRGLYVYWNAGNVKDIEFDAINRYFAEHDKAKAYLQQMLNLAAGTEYESILQDAYSQFDQVSPREKQLKAEYRNASGILVGWQDYNNNIVVFRDKSYYVNYYWDGTLDSMRINYESGWMEIKALSQYHGVLRTDSYRFSLSEGLTFNGQTAALDPGTQDEINKLLTYLRKPYSTYSQSFEESRTHGLYLEAKYFFERMGASGNADLATLRSTAENNMRQLLSSAGITVTDDFHVWITKSNNVREEYTYYRDMRSNTVFMLTTSISPDGSGFSNYYVVAGVLTFVAHTSFTATSTPLEYWDGNPVLLTSSSGIYIYLPNETRHFYTGTDGYIHLDITMGNRVRYLRQRPDSLTQPFVAYQQIDREYYSSGALKREIVYNFLNATATERLFYLSGNLQELSVTTAPVGGTYSKVTTKYADADYNGDKVGRITERLEFNQNNNVISRAIYSGYYDNSDQFIYCSKYDANNRQVALEYYNQNGSPAWSYTYTYTSYGTFQGAVYTSYTGSIYQIYFNSLWQKTKIIYSNGDRTEYTEYYSTGQVKTEKYYTGNTLFSTTNYSYIAGIYLGKTIVYNQSRITYNYNQLNQVVRITYADGSKKMYTYTYFGSVSTEQYYLANGTWSYFHYYYYDMLGRPTGALRIYRNGSAYWYYPDGRIVRLW